jgi:hypothetical protein
MWFTKEIKQEEDTQPAGTERYSNAVATYNSEVLQQDGELHHQILEDIVTLTIGTHIILRMPLVHRTQLTQLFLNMTLMNRIVIMYLIYSLR